MVKRARPAPLRVDSATGESVGIVGADSGGGDDSGSVSGYTLGADGVITIDPSAIDGPLAGGDSGGGGGSNGGDTGQPKRRGRKPGSTNRAKADNKISVESLAGIIVSTHMMLAALTKTAELQMDADEAMILADATAKVSRHYNVAVAAKTLDWYNLVMVVGTVYGSRLVAIRARMPQRSSGRSARGPSEPVQAPTPQANGADTIVMTADGPVTVARH